MNYKLSEEKLTDDEKFTTEENTTNTQEYFDSIIESKTKFFNKK